MAMDTQFYAFLFLLWLLSSYLFFTSTGLIRRRLLPATNGWNRNTENLPPSPMALPILGHLYLLAPLFHRSFDALAKRCGPIIHLRLGTTGDTVLVSSPALAREFLKSHDLAFASRPSLAAQDYTGGHDSLSFTFLPYGPRWKFFKKVLVTRLLSPRKLAITAGIRQEEIKLFLGSLLEKSRGEESADLGEMLPVLTNSIICRMIMSRKDESGECRKLIQEHVELSGRLSIVHLLMGKSAKLDLSGYGKRLKKANERFMEIVEKIIEEHEEKQQQPKQERKMKKVEKDGDEEEEEDLLGILLRISEDEEAECKLT